MRERIAALYRAVGLPIICSMRASARHLREGLDLPENPGATWGPRPIVWA